MKEKLEKVIENIKEKTKKESYSIKLLEEKPGILDSKIGGIPYMPKDKSYPRTKEGELMPLFVQINLEEIILENYPLKGILQLFVDKEFDYPPQYEVRYYEKIEDEYVTDLPTINLSQFVVSESIKIKLTPYTTFMTLGDFRFEEIFLKSFNEIFDTKVEDCFKIDEVTGIENSFDIVYEELQSEKGLIGGYADFTQTDPRKYDEKLKDYTECLIKIDSCIDMDKIMIGDAGIAWLLITTEDLKAKRFEKAVFDWDCC